MNCNSWVFDYLIYGFWHFKQYRYRKPRHIFRISVQFIWALLVFESTPIHLRNVKNFGEISGIPGLHNTEPEEIE